jgi:hypothetical protein
LKTLNKKKCLLISAITTAALLAAQPFANAFDLNTISSVPISVHGFATLAGGWNDSNQDYMSVDGDRAGIRGKRFDVKNSLVGLQVGAQLSQKLSFTTQIVGIYNDDFKAEATWAYLKYDFTPNVSLSLGRVRQPMFLYSDTYQVGATYPWVNPPLEIYSLIPWYNINGGMLNLSKSLAGSWGIKSQTYYGVAKSKVNFPLGIGDLRAFNVIGEDLSVSNDILTLQASYMHSFFDIKSLPQLSGKGVPKTPAYFIGLAAKLDYKNFLAITEIGKRQVGGTTFHQDHPGLGGEMPAYIGGYATVGYKYHNFLPSLTFSAIRTTNKSKVFDPTVLPTGGTNGPNPMVTTQNSFTAALKYNFNQNIDVKASIQRIYTCGGWGTFGGFREGTGSTFTTNTKPVGRPVNIYQVALDLIF